MSPSEGFDAVGDGAVLFHLRPELRHDRGRRVGVERRVLQLVEGGAPDGSDDAAAVRGVGVPALLVEGLDGPLD